MDAATGLHDVVSRLDDDSVPSSKEDKENTMKIMALFEINKPIQSAIIFESDNESNHSSSENETNTEIKRKKYNCSKTNRTRIEDKKSNLDTDRRDLNRINIIEPCSKETTTVVQVQNNLKDSVSGTPKVTEKDFHSKDMNTNDKKEDEVCSVSYIEKKIKMETNVEETNLRLEGKLENYNYLYDAIKEVRTKIKRELLEGNEDSFEIIKNQHESNCSPILNEKNMSHIEDTNKIQNSIQEKNTKSFNSANNEISSARDVAVPNVNKVTIDVIQNTSINVNFQASENNSVLSDFESYLENRSTSVSYTNNNVAMTNPPSDSYENSRTVNLLVREILNIMYDMINFKRYNEVLEKENTENSLKKNVQDEFEKYLITSLSNSWRSVVSHILNKESITYSFVFSVLSKGQAVAKNESNSFNERYFIDILKYFMKQYINERKASEAEQLKHNHSIPSAINNSTHINSNQDIASANKNYECNIRPVTNSGNANANQAPAYENNNHSLVTALNVVQMTNHNNANSNYTAVQTNGNISRSQFFDGTPYRDRAPYNINTDKNNTQILRNVNMEFDLTSSNIQAHNLTSPVVSDRIAVNNSLTQHSMPSYILPFTENITLSNTDGKYRNVTQKRAPVSVHAIDKRHQCHNAHVLKSNKTTQGKSNFSSNVNKNLLGTLPKYQTTAQIDYNISRSQFDYNLKNRMHSNRNTSYRSHLHQQTSPATSVSFGVRHDFQSQQYDPSPRKPYPPHKISKFVRNPRVEDSVHYTRPPPRMLTNHIYTANQDYRLNCTNYETTVEAYQTGVSTCNPEQARSSVSRDSGFMSPSTSFEQSAPSLPDTALSPTTPPRRAPIPDRPCTTMASHPCVVCGRWTIQRCSRCLSIYVCSNMCLGRAWASHSYVCRAV